MPDAVVTILTGSGVAGVFCLLFVLGLIVPKNVYDDIKAERDSYIQALKDERQRSDSAVAAASATSNVLAAIQSRAPSNTGGSP